MLSYDFNTLIKRHAPRHTAKDIAPDTYEKLISCRVSGLVVWAGASDHTIYGDPAVNWAFRAWHDFLHLKLNVPFNMEGEIIVAREQSRLIGSDQYGAIIQAEIVGQAEYFYKTGDFPVDQTAFILAYLQA